MPETPTVGDIPGTMATCSACLDEAAEAHRKGKPSGALFARSRHAFKPAIVEPVVNPIAPHTWDDLITEFIEWTMATFPHQTEVSAFKHAQREWRELESQFEADGTLDPIEMVDVVMLLLASQHSAGNDFKAEFARKLAVNKARRWSEPDADGVVEHVR